MSEFQIAVVLALLLAAGVIGYLARSWQESKKLESAEITLKNLVSEKSALLAKLTEANRKVELAGTINKANQQLARRITELEEQLSTIDSVMVQKRAGQWMRFKPYLNGLPKAAKSAVNKKIAMYNGHVEVHNQAPEVGKWKGQVTPVTAITKIN